MGKIEFEAERKNFGSPFVVAYDESNETRTDKSSILLRRDRFNNREFPRRVKITVEWMEE